MCHLDSMCLIAQFYIHILKAHPLSPFSTPITTTYDIIITRSKKLPKTRLILETYTPTLIDE